MYRPAILKASVSAEAKMARHVVSIIAITIEQCKPAQ